MARLEGLEPATPGSEDLSTGFREVPFRTHSNLKTRSLGIIAKTLRKRYRAELDEGTPPALAEVIRTAYGMATSGEHAAMTIFWLKTQASWREASRSEHTGANEGP